MSVVELILVVVIAGLLAASAALILRPTELTARYQAERLSTDLRHMQMLALAWGVTLRMTTSASGYSVSCASGAAGPCASTPVTDPATGSAFSVALESGLTLTGPGMTCGTGFCFDSLGRPTDGATPATLLSGNTTFTVAAAGGPAYTVAVRPLTGFALVAP